MSLSQRRDCYSRDGENAVSVAGESAADHSKTPSDRDEVKDFGQHRIPSTKC